MRTLLPFLCAYGASAGVALLLRPLFERLGLTSTVRFDRWGSRAVALAGGPAVVVGVLAGVLLFAPLSQRSLVFLGAFVFVALVGFRDDLRPLPPAAKIVAQVAAGALLVVGGIYVDVYFPLLGVPLSLLWFSSTSNAVNLIDNMDGVAAGVVAILCGWIAYAASTAGAGGCATAAAATAGAAAGVLPLNFPPARVFLGDSGALSLGLAAGALAVWATWRQASSLLVSLLVPLLFLAVPLYEVLFVGTTRAGRGASPVRGGRDHIAHRLSAAGLPPQGVALVFWAFAALTGACGALLADRPVLLLGAFATVCVLAGAAAVPIARLHRPRSPHETLTGGGLLHALTTHWRPTLLVTLDAAAFAVAFIAANVLRFGVDIEPAFSAAIARALPVHVASKLAAFLLAGRYRGSRPGALRLAGDVLTASLVSVAVLTFAFRFRHLSRGAFVIDLAVTFALCWLLRRAVACGAGASEEKR